MSENIDLVLAFYMVHEVPNQEDIFQQLASILKPSGKVLIVELPLHVSKKEFEQTVKKARDAGFTPAAGPKVFLSKTVVMKKEI